MLAKIRRRGNRRKGVKGDLTLGKATSSAAAAATTLVRSWSDGPVSKRPIKASAPAVLYWLMNGDASARKKGTANRTATATTMLAAVRRMNVRSNIPASMMH
jgi:hypothetical protein